MRRQPWETAYADAQSPEQCQEQFDQAELAARDSRRNARSAATGDALAGAIAIGVISGVVESRNNTNLLLCMQRVNGGAAPLVVTPSPVPPGPLPQSVPAVVPSLPSADCPVGASVLFGGVGYCT